jgi:hypothetical protein
MKNKNELFEHIEKLKKEIKNNTSLSDIDIVDLYFVALRKTLIIDRDILKFIVKAFNLSDERFI